MKKMAQKNKMEKKWNDKTKYNTYSVPLFSEEDIMGLSIEIVKKGVDKYGNLLNVSTLLMALGEKLDEVAQERVKALTQSNEEDCSDSEGDT